MVKIGIIGFGYMGKFHLDKFRLLDNAKVLYAYDTNPDRLLAANKEGLIGFADLDEFLSQDMELVIIATPNDVHAKLAIKALNSGKHVLCEKPATMNVQELMKVLKCAEKNQKIFTTHQNRRWDKDYLVVKEVCKNQLIGDITTIESKTFGQRGVCFGWRADPVQGGGMLYDWGIHLIDQLLLIFEGKKVISVYARLRSILTPLVDDYFELELEFEGDIVAHISVGTFALQEQPRWFVFGDKGTMKLVDFSGEIGGISKIKDEVKTFKRVVKSDSLGPSRTMAHLEKENLENISLPNVVVSNMEFHLNLVDAVSGKTEQFVKPIEMIRDMEIIDAAFESNRCGNKIRTSI